MPTTTVSAYAAPSPKAPLEPTTVTRREVGPHDVLIDIKFAGICHSDIHQAREEWGEAIFPMVPGHEIAGLVGEVGSEVTKYKIGDTVGVGCFVDSCRECENCLAGEEQHCTQGEVGTYNARFYDGEPTYGGYSTAIVVDESFVLRIPEGIDLAAAAPLLCAGITLYSPLEHWEAGPGKKVAILGMGGLGHMGVKIAHAMGAEVTVLSHGMSKKADGERFGADHYYATSDPATFVALKNTFDLIINTVSVNLDLAQYISLLKRNGTFVVAGLPEHPTELPAGELLAGRRRIAGTKNGGIAQTQRMLDFCAQHGLAADIEVVPAEKINEAWGRVVEGDVRYRFVIDTATLPAA
ncbi:alcohol dehydrogenase catalytic domain-containing protein [Nakamurella sp. YIM 132087]|uniref:alcohol dehydrogenase (NADP(+)) n=1 Tax=Nakamurella alba TaxID=2665158 RepID=A0A7K1FTF4_9ACTN|nr:NAD(P)-dependent alcohol dehydrogenase [Nakamurella alba]MTD17442.1 alcohol dehydrogenase catalytic domain-containing protein [Nakamurella alba]